MDVAYCWDGCGRPAVRERLSGMAGEDEVVELVCELHAIGGLLACGHADDDPYAWHTEEDGSIVCSVCCTYCNKEKEL